MNQVCWAKYSLYSLIIPSCKLFGYH
uniref:Uncharacterized protein n=1 Tax=Rhizophora mucronata TaxID=61149 RepID=A0A2P2PXT1_RHIMU